MIIFTIFIIMMIFIMIIIMTIMIVVSFLINLNFTILLFFINLESTATAWRLTMINNEPETPTGLWEYNLQLPGITCNEDDSVFFPTGYGALYSNPASTIKT